jgi:hypothetical protein
LYFGSITLTHIWRTADEIQVGKDMSPADAFNAVHAVPGVVLQPARSDSDADFDLDESSAGRDNLPQTATSSLSRSRPGSSTFKIDDMLSKVDAKLKRASEEQEAVG